MTQATKDAAYMNLALSLARRCKPVPNPQVGAVIVKNERVIGQGYHHAPGMPHAEIEALRDAESAGMDVIGATMYVTLEPCCHHGRTGPCCEAIHRAGIGRVVVGMKDPDRLVAGKGISYLEAHGHAVVVGIEEPVCASMLNTYVQQRRLGRPLFHLKAAITLDGFIATTTGDSKWITGPVARAKGHELRAEHDAILIGIGTVLADDPLLTVRDAAGTNPIRVILDSTLRIPLTSQLLQSTDEAPLMIMHGPNIPTEKIEALSAIRNVSLHRCDIVDHRLKIADVVEHLNNKGFLSVLIEGGSTIHGSFIKEQYADQFSLFIAPKLLGSGISWAGFSGISAIDNAITAEESSIKTILLNADTLIEGKFNH